MQEEVGNRTVTGSGSGTAFSDPTEDPNAWSPTLSTGTDEDLLKEKVGNLLGIINTIGVVVSVVMIGIIGIKYMLGSVEEKADYKKAMIPYVVGVFMLVSVTTIPNIIYTIVTSSGFFG